MHQENKKGQAGRDSSLTSAEKARGEAREKMMKAQVELASLKKEVKIKDEAVEKLRRRLGEVARSEDEV